MGLIPRRLSLAGLLGTADPDPVKLEVARRRRGTQMRVRWCGAPGQPALQNGWTTATNGEPAGFQKTSDGFVRLFGSLGHSNAAGGLQTLFTLPLNYRPAQIVTFSLFEHFEGPSVFPNPTNYLRSYIRVEPDGQVRVDAQGPISYVTLDGRRFQAAN